MKDDLNIDSIAALFEFLPLSHKLILNTIDIKNSEFTKTQLIILMALMDKPHLTMTEIATYIASSKEQATRAVAPLVKLSYVTRFTDDSNRKQVLIKLTKEGISYVNSAKEYVKNKMVDQFKKLSDSDKAKFHESMLATLDILKKLV